MSGYLCDRCGHGKHKDNDGFNTVKPWGERERVLCDACFLDALEDHENCTEVLELVNGEPPTRPEPVLPWVEAARSMPPLPPGRYTPEEVERQYLANCATHKWPPYVLGRCRECGHDMLAPHAEAIMERGEYNYTGCRRCGRTYCD